MEFQESRKWYKKKRYLATLIVAGIFVVSGLINSSDSNETTSTQIVQPPVQEIVQPQPKLTPVPQAQIQPFNSLSNDNYYTNVDGNEVHSPAYSDTVPIGASAKCRDGTYSFSQNRRGTCSRHGGVGTWY